MGLHHDDPDNQLVRGVRHRRRDRAEGSPAEGLGASLAAGDVDWDGVGDWFAGAPQSENAAEAVVGGIACGVGGARFRLIGADLNGLTGVSVASGVDLNGHNTQDDIAIGVPLADTPDRGDVYVAHGDQLALVDRELTPTLGPDARIRSPTESSYFGWSVAMVPSPAGLLVGAPSRGDVPGVGTAYLFAGADLGVGAQLTTADAVLVLPGEVGESAGLAVQAVGDWNRDRVGDLVVAAPLGNLRGGIVRVYDGTATGTLQPADAVATFTGEPGAEAGGRLASGDVDGDGCDDLLVGGSGGVAYLVLCGAGSGDLADVAVATFAGEDFARFGQVVAFAPDLDGDGGAEVLLGAPQHSGGAGAAFLYTSARIALGPAR